MSAHQSPTRVGIGLLAVAILAAMAFAIMAPAAEASGPCTAVNTSRGPLTANLVNPPMVNGNVDANGCDIAVYFDQDGTVNGATLSAATARDSFAVFNDGANVDVRNSTVDSAFVGVLYANGASGNIAGNTISGYERGGIVVSGNGTNAQVAQNAVTGSGVKPSGPAENGIQVSYGATGTVAQNTVANHWWAPADWASAGILVFESDNVKVRQNVLADNQRGVGIESWAWNLTSTTSADNNKVVRNIISGSQIGISVHAYAIPGRTNADPTADQNSLVNNDISNSEQYAISVLAYDYGGADFESSVWNTKVIANRTHGDDVEVWNTSGTQDTKLPPPFE